MNPVALSVLTSDGVGALFDALRRRGFRVLGPTMRDRAIVCDDIAGLADLPRGWTDEQEGGHYRLIRRDDDAFNMLYAFGIGEIPVSVSGDPGTHPPARICPANLTQADYSRIGLHHPIGNGGIRRPIPIPGRQSRPARRDFPRPQSQRDAAVRLLLSSRERGEQRDRTMRLMVVRAALVGLAAALSGCVAAGGPAPVGFQVSRVDPEDAADRALVGSVLGTALGTGLGAAFAINPGIGAVVGAETGATLGAVAGAMTAQPLPGYAPIAVPTAAVIPGFYDTWPPGFHPPPIGSQTPPPPRPG